MGNLTAVSPDRESFKEKVRTVYPDTKKGAVPTAAGVLYRFTYEKSYRISLSIPQKLTAKCILVKLWANINTTLIMIKNTHTLEA